MSLIPPTAEAFRLQGQVWALRKARQQARRPMGGWLMTYGKIDDDGAVVPTVDRDGQVAEAARELGRIDWQPYLKGGLWNDTHDEEVIVGMPTYLEFHDATSPLAKAHRKVGFFTEGHLFDRTDPSSWDGLGRTPSPHEFDRADHFWAAAELLKGTPRPLGLSAHGLMALSPCKSRIIYARVNHAAVCELPVNPDATLEPMLKAVLGTPLALIRRGMTNRGPCGRCSCPVGACQGMLKAVHAGNLPAVVPEDLETPTPDGEGPQDAKAQLTWLIQRVMDEYKVGKTDAERWVRDFLTNRETR